MVSFDEERKQLRGRISTERICLSSVPIGDRKKYIVDTFVGQLVACLFADLMSGLNLVCPLFAILCVVNRDLMRDYDILPLDIIQAFMMDVKK